MAGRLQAIESLLRDSLYGGAAEAPPELVYAVSRILFRFGHSDEPAALWDELDSLLFNAFYGATGGSMRLPGGPRMRTEDLRALADRLLSLAYADREPDAAMKDRLFDLARAGSFTAMRVLAARYPLQPDERAYLLRVLSENGELP